MPKSEEHAQIGLTAGLICSGFNHLNKDETIRDSMKTEEIVIQFGLASVGGLIGGLLPDIIEPSYKNPNHRSFFHSVGFGTMLIASIKPICDQNIQNPIIRLFFNGIIAGYVSHLLGDLSTTKGLPIIV